MRIKIVVVLFIVFVSGKTFAQITDAENGLNNTADPTKVLLGGLLKTNTSIDLGASFTFDLKKGAASYFHMLNNGNIGIGNSNPQFKLHVNGNTGLEGATYIGGENSYLQLNRNHIGPNPLIDIVDVMSSGRLLLGGGSSNGFTPTITFKPDAFYNMGLIQAQSAQDVAGPYPAFVIDTRSYYGALANQDLFGISSGMIFKLKLAANGNLMLGSNMTDNGKRMQVDGEISSGGLLLQGKTADPTIANGGIIYNSTTNQFKGYRNGVWKNFLMDGDASGSSSSNAWSLGGNANTSSTDYIGTPLGNTQPLVFKTNGNEALRVNSTGQVVIGTETGTSIAAATEYKLAVGGAIIAEKVKVKLQSSGWPDYVFQNGYALPSIKEVEAFIKKHQHLPDVPSANDVEEKGLDVGDNQAVLLKKIEELTLYMIEINNKVEKLEKENEALKKEKQ